MSEQARFTKLYTDRDFDEAILVAIDRIATLRILPTTDEFWVIEVTISDGYNKSVVYRREDSAVTLYTWFESIGAPAEDRLP